MELLWGTDTRGLVSAWVSPQPGHVPGVGELFTQRGGHGI